MNTFILIENGKVVGTTTFESLEGYEVLPAPEGWDGNLERLKYENGQLTLIPEEEYIELKRQELLKKRIDQLNQATDDYFYSEAEDRGGYKNMGEIVYDAQQGDSDARFLLKLYDAIWNKEEELEDQLQGLSLSELEQLNVQELTSSTYEQVKENLGNSGE